MTQTDSAQTYVNALQTFSDANLESFLALCADDIDFRDPFNETHTKAGFEKVLRHMLKQVKQLKFDVDQHWVDGDAMVVKWRFSGNVRFIGRLDIPGVSEVKFNETGLVSRHIDYWDANEHVTSRLPLLGWFVRLAMTPMKI